MKKSLSVSLIIALIAILFLSCKKDSIDTELQQAQLEFTFSASQLKSALKSTVDSGYLMGITSAVITIEDSQGNVVKNSEKIEIYNMNGHYISKPISLVIGNYKLSRFVLLSSSNQVVYASPVEGSDLAYLVEKPLPLLFGAQKDSVTKLNPEVLSTADSRPEDFGYATFSFDIAETFNFLVGALIYNDTIRNYELTDASIFIYSDSSMVYSGQLHGKTSVIDLNYDSLGITNKITLPEKFSSYTIVISKPGYTSYSKTFTKEELRLQYRKEDKGPLMVVLVAGVGCDFITKFNAFPYRIWPDNVVPIENISIEGADSYVFDFGDGITINQTTYVTNFVHIYTSPGIYVIKLMVTKDGCTGSYEQEVSILQDTSSYCNPNAGNDTTVYVNHLFLNAQAVNDSIGTWSVVSGRGIFINQADPLTEVINLGEGTNIFRWTVKTYNCNAYDDVTTTYLPTNNEDSTVTDIDGNTYHTVKIGTQVWMVENLKTTRFNNGTFIPNIADSASWATLTTPSFCLYNNYGTIYGALYNWYSVNTGKLAPKGWHVPTDAEWTTLTTYLGGDSDAGGKMKEIGTLHWRTPNIGASNNSGFTALPGGFLDPLGNFEDIGTGCSFWSSSENSNINAWIRGLNHGVNNVEKREYNKNSWISVRCIHD